jgi:putative membrane protein
MSSERLDGPRRLHPAAIVLEALGALREAAVPLVVALVLGVGTGGPDPLTAALLGLGGVALTAVVGFLRWQGTTYTVTPTTLRHRTGLVSPDETVVPLGRIQAIDTVQGPVQRLFGVLELRVQTAGGGRAAEVVLTAVTRAEAAALRAHAGLPDAPEHPEARLRLGGRELLVTALTAPQVGVLLPVLAAVGGVAQQLTDEVDRSWLDRLPDTPEQVALAAGGLVAAALVVSVLGAVVAFAGFEVRLEGDRLRIRRGLLRRRAATVPLARVHAVRLVEGVLREPLGLASLRLETAGYREEAAAAQTLFPLVRRAEAEAVLARFVPALAGALDGLEPPPARAARRYVLPAVVAALVPAVALVVVVPAAWPAAPAAVALVAAHGWARFRAAGWRLDGGRVVVRSRRLARTTLVARVARLQEHSLAQTPLQRRAGLARLAVAVGSGRRAAVAHLELAVARALFDRLRQPPSSSRPSARPRYSSARPVSRTSP